MYANILLHATPGNVKLFLLDTGAGSSFIQKDLIPKNLWNMINESQTVNILGAKNRKLHTRGTINYLAEVVNKIAMVSFNVFELLSTNVLFCCDYCDWHVELIKTH